MDLGQRAVVLRCLEAQCGDGQLLVDLFVNYDCDLEGANLFERTVGVPVCSILFGFHVSEHTSVWSPGTSVRHTSLRWSQATAHKNALCLGGRQSEAAIWDTFPRAGGRFGTDCPDARHRRCVRANTGRRACSTSPGAPPTPCNSCLSESSRSQGWGPSSKVWGRFRPQNARPHQTCWIARRSGAV